MGITGLTHAKTGLKGQQSLFLIPHLRTEIIEVKVGSILAKQSMGN